MGETMASRLTIANAETKSAASPIAEPISATATTFDGFCRKCKVTRREREALAWEFAQMKAREIYRLCSGTIISNPRHRLYEDKP